MNSKRTRGAAFRIPLAAVGDPRKATHIPVRLVEYTVTGSAEGRESEVFRLITTILDPDEGTAGEIAAAYQERWEYEIVLKEIETQMFQAGSGLRFKRTGFASLPRTGASWVTGQVISVDGGRLLL